jgi:hypothetical protein
LTNVLLDQAMDRAVFDQVTALAGKRGSQFVPVILECEEAELLRRLASPGRTERLKETNVSAARQRLREHRLLPIEHANVLRLYTTQLSAEMTANAILSHLGRSV